MLAFPAETGRRHVLAFPARRGVSSFLVTPAVELTIPPAPRVDAYRGVRAKGVGGSHRASFLCGSEMDAGRYDGFAEDIAVKLEPIDEDVKGGWSGKRERKFGFDPFSESEERNIRQKLDVGLSRNETMQRPGPGGCRLTYIEGWKVIHDANQIFGFNGWSSRVVTLDLRYLDENNNRFNACVCATVRITLRDGSYREDRGGGSADNMRSKGDAILKAEKEAVTDATKRALKNFGLRLGLSLYDRQHVREMNKPQLRAPAKQGNAATASGVHTPQASRVAPGSSHRMTAQGFGVSPVTPGLSAKAGVPLGSGTTAPKCIGNANEAKEQFAAQRELALKRKQAFLQAKAAEEKANMQKGNDHGGVVGQNGTSENAIPPHGHRNGCGVAAGIAGPIVQPAGAQIGNAFSAGSASLQAMQRPGSATGAAGCNMRGQAPGQRGPARPPSSGSDSSRGYVTRGVGQAYGGQRPGGVSGVSGTTGPARQSGQTMVDMARRQQEIDELTSMALTDL